MQAGTKIEIGTLEITYFRSAECQIHDATDFTPGRKPNTRAAVASIVLVPLALLIVGVVLYSKYSKQVGTGGPEQGARTEGVWARYGSRMIWVKAGLGVAPFTWRPCKRKALR